MAKTNNLEITNILRLIRSENVGPRTFWNLLDLYGSATNALEHVAELSLRNKKEIKILSKSLAEEQIADCERNNVQILTYLDYSFPKLLKNIDDCPPLLFCLGNTELLNKRTFAIVGSRNASANGIRFAYKISKQLVDNNMVVVSGFARGIDNAAHKASVDSATIAIMAGGIDHIYPPEFKDLYHEIIEKGLIVAELPLGTIPKAQNFPQRNRIISGISYGVAIIESSLDSGSLITAKFALQQNREVFAVPGFPMDPRYHGNNYLLKQGAHLLESGEDIIEVVENSVIKRSSLFEQKKSFINAKSNISSNNFSEKELTQARLELINLLSASPTSIDELVSITQLPVGLILTSIIELELSGKIIRHFGNKISATINI
ncbi:MAG: DNA-processing protein DprA [Rickettsiales bacterium]